MLWFKYPFFILFSSTSYCSYANSKYAKSKAVFFLMFIMTIATTQILVFNIFTYLTTNSYSWEIYVFDLSYGLMFLLIFIFSFFLYKSKDLWLKKKYFLISLFIFVVMLVWEFLFLWYTNNRNENNELFATANLMLVLLNIFLLFLFIEVVSYQWNIIYKTPRNNWDVKQINIDEIEKYKLEKDYLYWSQNEIIDINNKILYDGSYVIKNYKYEVKHIFKFENKFYELFSYEDLVYNFFVKNKDKFNIEISQKIINLNKI